MSLDLHPYMHSNIILSIIIQKDFNQTISSNILKPITDERNYQFIKLNKNNLHALIIQDKTTDKAAAALDVNAGAFMDPSNLPGLAHFCEHLLFMGSKNFPNENDYSSYLNQNGGFSNAYTGSMNTNYHFEINHANLFEALRRFSCFFKTPLFNNDSTIKEIHAIDSENKKNLQNDYWRLYQLGKSLSNHEHPYHKFSTGSKLTLLENTETLNLNIREELIKFYNKWYSSNIMNLCIIGREDLGTLSRWAKILFENVPNKNVILPTFSQPVWTIADKKKVISVKPVKDLKQLELTFHIKEDELTTWKSKPSYILSHLFGHKGNGSISSLLKNQQLITGISSGSENISKENSLFSLNFDLTEDGINQYEKIIKIVFQYIKMLNSNLPQEWIYNELKGISDNSFKYKQKINPASTVSQLSKRMEKTFIPINNILSHELFYEYDPQQLNKYLKFLTPDNSRIMLVSKNLNGLHKSEKWYGTKYGVKDYPDGLLKDLSNIKENSELYLPHKNEFISTTCSVKKVENHVAQIEPYLLKDDNISKLWYKKDDTFWLPRATIFVSIKLPHTHSSLVANVLTSFYINLVNDALQDLRCYAACADLYVSLNKTNQGLDLTLTGLNDKLLILLKRYLEGIKSFVPNEERFEVIKKQTIQSLTNRLYDVPYIQMGDIYSSLINERSWSVEENLKVVQDIDFPQLQDFIPTIYQELFFETLAFGNIQYEQAQEVDSLVRTLIPNTIKNSQVKNDRLRSYIIPSGKTFKYEVFQKDKNNLNTCIQYICQFGIYSEYLAAVVSLLAQIMHEPCFNTLRTKEQLGYIVFSSSLSNHGTCNLSIMVQSEYSTDYLQFRIENFLKDFLSYLKEMPREEFKRHRQSLHDSLLQKYHNMNEESSRLIAAIYLGDYNFTHREKKAIHVSKLSKFDVIYFFEQHVLGQDACRLITSLKSHHPPIEGKYPLSEKYKGILEKRNETNIVDIDQFKSHLCIAPARQPYKEWKVYSKAADI
ncbi:hypothetical protein TBLA_0A08050 [Henningerozyma blattae CBS 6284]|uniref:Peptidase M16 N-terminal domain-containing protein n=1 Tax=Henningerozyma blattae (strain ATCC 34711 / CBS 6284 / DSM 70876 / NBRC 10599 / NRRL Y-10934 / UCD 77-7) TaxID=1071380 RepID=I2GWU3_HENB6|nr:hypothetical protein TBLA_0A08050 [Tetrapisispora blattae CBS 6284]CCH58595.1 hypothetical protein TBLA_0A08050 [Tetrapisispora blattae CBS 6284]